MTAFFAVIGLIVVLLFLYVLFFILIWLIPADADRKGIRFVSCYMIYMSTCFLSWYFIVPKLIELYAISI